MTNVKNAPKDISTKSASSAHVLISVPNSSDQCSEDEVELMRSRMFSILAGEVNFSCFIAIIALAI